MASDLDTIEAALWGELERAAHTKDHPWRTPVLATADGAVPDARTVVLREIERPVLRFFTDRRAPKLAQMERQSQGTLVMWSEVLRWQLRLRVQLGLMADEAAIASRWARLQASAAAQDYLWPLAPGATLGGPGAMPARPEIHFAVVQAQVTAIDWLELRPTGHHRRAVFDDQGSRWVQP